MFGTPLVTQTSIEQRQVPWLVEACLGFVEKYGLRMEGVYRKSASTSETKLIHHEISLRSQFRSYNGPLGNDSIDVSAITSILKQYLRDLPNPVICFESYPAWIEAIKNRDVDRRVSAIQHALTLMPFCHQLTLELLVRHLNLVEKHSDANRMNSKNLAVVFGPTLLKSPEGPPGQEFFDMGHKSNIVDFLI
ncbi:RhoGAP-domain-containing protein, partial [Ramicandelaber brevisporus]